MCVLPVPVWPIVRYATACHVCTAGTGVASSTLCYRLPCVCTAGIGVASSTLFYRLPCVYCRYRCGEQAGGYMY